MGFYSDQIEPRFVECACGTAPISKQRKKVVPRAKGTVLEIGFGAGQNLPFYNTKIVDKLYALEPSASMRKRATKRISESPLEIEFLDLPSEQIPLPDDSIDTILITYTLCTIPDVDAAVREMHRVIKPDGILLFSEHGRAPDQGTRKFQNRVNNAWKRVAGGCNLNRNIPQLLRDGGFAFDDLEAAYLPMMPKTLGYNYWGSACPS
ncbi:MAG: class I SAM-dependent methyltransferase, partial [Pseudomonadota bacterium]